MDKIIQQLTHDNDLLDEQWPDIYTKMNQTSIPDDSKIVINSLVDYLLAEPMDSSPSYVKALLITNITENMIHKQASIETNDLLNAFLRILDSPRVDSWYLTFLETVYQHFQLGERFSSIPIQIDLIEKILLSLKNKAFVFDSEEIAELWRIFLTQIIFSNSIDTNNILNKQDIMKQMQTNFQEFYKHAIQQSQKSSTWLEIATTLKESSPEIFDNVIACEAILFNQNISIENISSDYITLLMNSYKNDKELIKNNYKQLLEMIQRLILVDDYQNSFQLISKIIIRNLSLIDLEFVLSTMIRFCSIIKDRSLFCSEILEPLVRKLENLQIQKKLAFVVFDLAVAILQLHVSQAPDLSYRLLNIKKFYPWEELINGLTQLIKTFISYDTIIVEEHSNSLDNLESITDLIYEKSQVYPIISKTIHPIVIDAILRWLNEEFNGNNHVYQMGSSLMNFMNVDQINEDICMKFIDALQRRVVHHDEESNVIKFVFYNNLSKHLGSIIEHLEQLSFDIHSKLITLLISLLDYPFYDEDNNMTFHYITLIHLSYKLAKNISNESNARLYEPFLDRLYIDGKESNKQYCDEVWIVLWNIIGSQLQTVAVDHIEQFFDYTFKTKNMSLTSLLLTLCILSTDFFCSRFDDLIDLMLFNNGKYLSHVAGFFPLIVRKHPEIVTVKHLDLIFSSVEKLPFNNELCMIIQALSLVTNYHPDFFDIHREQLIRLVIEKQNILICECFRNYIITSSIVNDETKVNEYLNILIDLLKKHVCSDEIRNDVLYTCLLIGLKYKQLLIDRRQDFTTLNANLIVNYIDNKVPSRLDENAIIRAELDIENIEQCLNKTKPNTKTEQINTNNIPSWSGEVSKLLNPKNNNDWRLLGKRLGFSPSEIKYFAMKTNPCMALLNELFITHTRDDAIFSLIQILNEISRNDAEQIIRQAVLKSGQIIPHEIPVVIKHLPPVFLSFHSNEYIHINRLKDDLKKFGYPCQLYDDQIDVNIQESYIRGAKVVVCCINTLYCQSENCSNIFQLMLNMKKPFILLYMEKQIWPPESKLKSKLLDHLYIEFFIENMTNICFEKKFIELLGQIRYYVAPDIDMICSAYHNWFAARVDSLIFLKYSVEKYENNMTSLKYVPLVVFHPQIIISYQWDCQKDIVNLYKLLTQLGYRVWVNIFQMSGGESLLDKYTYAIDQSSCLLACITPKYMKSIDCQHELSLANILHKPIIPLLLEETPIWPPKDTVVSLFPEKSSIDFQHANEYNRWTGKSYQLLLSHLRQLIPHVQTDKPRHLIEMQRPISASRHSGNIDQRAKRISSAPIIPKSQACSLM